MISIQKHVKSVNNKILFIYINKTAKNNELK